MEQRKKVKALLYCTKTNLSLYKDNEQYFTMQKCEEKYNNNEDSDEMQNRIYNMMYCTKCNGFIIAECEIVSDFISPKYNYLNAVCNAGPGYILDKCHLTKSQFCNYGQGKPLYALQIQNLSHFETPKPLTFYKNSKKENIIRAPQNMCYAYDENDNEYVLISIQPQHLVRILNQEKTIEVRRQVLKSLKKY